MKLFIDDIRLAPDDTWTVARTITQAIRLLHTQKFEEISLDHDIDNHPDETFMAVAMYIVERYSNNAAEWRPRIIIHTGNPVGSEKMYAVFKDVGITALCIPRV